MYCHYYVPDVSSCHYFIAYEHLRHDSQIIYGYVRHSSIQIWGRDGIVEEPPVHVYYAYLKPT